MVVGGRSSSGKYKSSVGVVNNGCFGVVKLEWVTEGEVGAKMGGKVLRRTMMRKRRRMIPRRR